ncbi:MAG: ABC transporter permease [Anaerolineales bacterium]|nr:ABC transporter permease [Anaerolineales bacterium]
MRLLDVTAKDVTQILRDWKSAAFLLGAPILFTVLMGVMMGGLADSSEAEPRLAVGVLDRDGGAAAQSLARLLELAEAVRPVTVGAEDAESLERQVAEGKLAAAVVVPEGFTDALLAGEDLQLEFLIDENSGASRNAENAVRAVVFRLMNAVRTALWSADIVAERDGFTDESDRRAYLEQALREAVGEWEAAPVALQLRSASPPEAGADAIPGGFAQSSPGNMVTFALAGLIGAAEIIVWEKKSGTLQRLLTTSISRAEILAGHFLAMFLMVFAQVVLLAVFGQLVFGLPYWQAPAALLLLAAAVTFWIAAMGLLIGVVARNPDQIAMMAIVPMMVLAGLGGAWMPLEVTGETFQAVGRLTPTYWAMHGMQNLILRGQGLPGVILPTLVLCGFGAAFIGLSAWRFHRE